MRYRFSLLCFLSLFFVGSCQMASQNKNDDVLGGSHFELLNLGTLKKSRGKTLQCVVELGSAQFQKGWYDFEPSEFKIKNGERLKIELVRKKKSEKSYILGRFERDKQKLVFCPYLNVAKDQKVPCASYYALEDDFEHGIRRTFDVPKAVRGGTLRCGYNQAGPKIL